MTEIFKKKRSATELARSLRLYAVSDRAWVGRQTFAEQIESALSGGATTLQLREKTLDADSFLREAVEIKRIAARFNVPLIIDDSLDVALACDADGIHVGQSDLDAREVRRRIGPKKILGVSAQTVEQAKRAEDCGADYLGVGAVFATTTKLDAQTVDFATLKAICESVSIPIVAIGGITLENVERLRGSGIVGVAVVSAIFAQNDVAAATRELDRKTRFLFGNGE